MLSEIRTKIRALTEDFAKSDFQIFSYTNSPIFTLAEPNIAAVTEVLINGNELQSGESYSFDSLTNKITISGVSFNLGDKIEVDFTFNQFSDTELDEYIRAALVWLSIYDYTEGDFEIESNGIFPTLSNKEEDMVAIIASILIRPDYTSYRLPNVSVMYPEHSTKEERIKDLINYFKHGSGAVGVINWHQSTIEHDIVDSLLLTAVKTETKYLDLQINRKTQTVYTLEILTKNGYIVDMTGGVIYVTVKEKMEDDDVEAVIAKDIVPSSPSSGIEKIIFSSSETDISGNFYYDIKFKDSDGNSYILFRGRVKFIDAVTTRA
jgi:hypothetical protein